MQTDAPGNDCRQTSRFDGVRGRRGVGALRRCASGKLQLISKCTFLRQSLQFLRYNVGYQLGVRHWWSKGKNIKRINLLAVEHCNNSCKHCSTSSPFASRKFHDAQEFFPWLDLLAQKGIKFGQIAITGGEPFLHPAFGEFVQELRNRYPDKELGVTTNFFWANEQNIAAIAPKLKGLDRVLISKYPNIVAKAGGNERFEALVVLLRQLCPQIEIAVTDGSQMIAWEIHHQMQAPHSYCCTSDCYVLRCDGRISHCAVGAGIENRRDYASILQSSKEALYDLRAGTDGLLSWLRKYPFDLCFHCSLWRGSQVPWQAETIRAANGSCPVPA